MSAAKMEKASDDVVRTGLEKDGDWRPSPELLAAAKEAIDLGEHRGDIPQEILVPAMIMHAATANEDERVAKAEKYPWLNSPELLAHIEELRSRRDDGVIDLNIEQYKSC